MTHQTFSPRPGTTLGYVQTTGSGDLPGVIFLSGYKSDMTGTKATYLEAQCRKRGQPFVRFDYTGCPASSGDFNDGTIGLWAEDTLAVIDQLTTGPQILVGSSMGGWLALLAALKRPERVHSLVLIAAAPDFTEEIWRDEFTDAQRAEVEKNGIIYTPSNYGDPYSFTRAFFEDGRQNLLLNAPMDIRVPVRLLHGREDDSVPWEKSEKIKSLLTSDDVEITWIDDGDHRLSRDPDLLLIDAKIVELSRR